MLSCREATRLMNLSMERRLTWRQQLSLYWHLRACRLCRRYRRQLQVLDSALLRAADLIVPLKERLSDQARERIRKRLKTEGERGTER